MVLPAGSGRAQEAESTKTMINRVEDRFGVKPKRLIGDTAYGTAAMLNWIVETKQIEPHTPATQESGDAVCAYEAHLKTGPSTIAWHERRT